MSNMVPLRGLSGHISDLTSKRMSPWRFPECCLDSYLGNSPSCGEQCIDKLIWRDEPMLYRNDSKTLFALPYVPHLNLIWHGKHTFGFVILALEQTRKKLKRKNKRKSRKSAKPLPF
jgi:hypothetical protein